MLSTGGERLPARRGGAAGRERLVAHQRARVLEALAEVVAERGLGGASVGLVVGRAFVSRASFVELFGSLERCFAVLVGEFMGRAANVVWEAFEGERLWRDGVLAGLQALLFFLDLAPVLARVGLIDAWASPAAMREHRERTVRRLMPLLEGAHDAPLAGERLPEVAAEATIYSVAGILRARVLTGQAPPFGALLGELAAVSVLPHLGMAEAAEALREGERRSQALPRYLGASGELSQAQAHGDDDVRLPRQLSRPNAHKARAVVLFVAEHPGASNKAIARGIDVPHLGQASTLLARLEGAGVLAKHPGGAGRPNAWTLTAYGEQVALKLCRR